MGFFSIVQVVQNGPQWSEAISAAVAVYEHVFTQRLISVYVRGSVPRGLALDGVSDLDMLGETLNLVDGRRLLNNRSSSLAHPILKNSTASP
jgi:hypothetical protein